MSKPIVKFVKMHPDAKLPVYSTPGAAGADLFALDDLHIAAGNRALISTGLKIEVPPGYEAQVRARSGLALKNGVMVLNGPGTIDEDYRGALGVILFNTTSEDFRISTGDRIAQLVVKPVEQAQFQEVEALSETKRGEGGFGSTGIAADPLSQKIYDLAASGFRFATIEDFTQKCDDVDMIGRAAQIVSSLQFEGADHSHVTWEPNRGSGAWLLIGSREEVVETCWAYLQDLHNEDAANAA